MLQILLLAGFIMWFQSSKMFWLLAWPGTVMHEFAHYITGLVLFASPSNFSVMPEPPDEDGTVCLGSVTFENLGWWNVFPIAIAPLVLFPIGMYLANKMSFSWTWVSMLQTWIVASAVAMCFPSRQDWKVGFSRPFGVVFWAAMLWLAFR